MGAVHGRCHLLHRACCTIDVAECRQLDSEELLQLRKGYLEFPQHFGSRGRFSVPEGKPMHVFERFLADSTLLYQVLAVLNDEERFWVEYESRKRQNLQSIPAIFLPHNMDARIDPVFDESVDCQLQQLYSKNYENRIARRIKSSTTLGWFVPPSERIFSSFILEHEVPFCLL
jgi:hypothetical protein